MSEPHTEVQAFSTQTVKETLEQANKWLKETNETNKIINASITRNDFWITILFLYQTNVTSRSSGDESGGFSK